MNRNDQAPVSDTQVLSSPVPSTPRDMNAYLPTGAEAETMALHGLTSSALGLIGSEVLKIAAEIRELQARGAVICNLTVGDFSPAQFAIPEELEAGIQRALAAGQTNYPASDGMIELRKAVVRLYARELGLEYPVSSVLIAGGARPIIYATFRAIVEPGDKVVYPTPSWNNNHYAYLAGAVPIEVPVHRDDNFMPSARSLEPLLRDARLLCLNTPLNPSGTMLEPDQAEEIGRLVVEENARRRRTGERLLFLMYDQVYWMLTFGGRRHVTPLDRVPEAAPYVIFVDGISKCFAATGLRVGWAVAPPYVTSRMRDYLGHVGAWAPRPEQVATAGILDNPEAIQRYLERTRAGLQARLDDLYQGIQGFQAEGLPVDAISPQGAIYLSVRFGLIGRTMRGETCRTNEQIRRYLLEEAGIAMVPFQAFGLKEESGWFRLSVGAVSREDIREGLSRLKRALQAVVAG